MSAMKLNKTLIAALLTAALAGCARQPPTYIVQQPQAVPPQTAPVQPPAPPAAGTLDSTITAFAARGKNPMMGLTLTMYSNDLRIGELFNMNLSVAQDAYLHLYLFQHSGKVVALSENLAVRAGQQVPFPPRSYKLRAAAPTGTNKLLLIATPRPVAGVAQRNFRPLPQPRNINGSELAAVDAIIRQVSPFADSEWSAVVRDVYVHP